MATQQHRDGNDRLSPNGHLLSNGLHASSPHLPRWRNYTAFVLSGGTARGALQVGALRALFERDIRPDVIIGTSIGAWNGAWLARNPTLESIAALEDLWRTVHPVRVLLGREPLAGSPQQAVRAGLMLAAAQRFAAGAAPPYCNAGFKKFVKKALCHAHFEQIQMPLYTLATHLTHTLPNILR